MSDIASLLESAKEGSTVQLPPGTHAVRAPIVLTKSMRVRGADDGSTVLDAGGVCGIFLLLGEGQSYALETLTLQGGAGRMGGAISAPNHNTIAVEGCRFVDNDTEIGGGAAILHHARGYFRRCIFERNNSAFGGALGVGTACDVTIDRCVFVGNTADAGGAVFLDDDGALEIRSTTFVQNAAKREGCGNALYAFGNSRVGPSSFVANSIFSEEEALSSDPGSVGIVFLTHSVVPKGALGRSGFKDVGGNLEGPVELVDLGGGAWALAPGSAAIGIADVTRIDRGAVDIAGARLVQNSRASPGALAVTASS